MRHLLSFPTRRASDLCKVPGHEGRPPSAGVMAASLALQGALASGRAIFGPTEPAHDPRMAVIRAYEEQGNAPAPPIQKSGGESTEFSLVRQRELARRSSGGGGGSSGGNGGDSGGNGGDSGGNGGDSGSNGGDSGRARGGQTRLRVELPQSLALLYRALERAFRRQRARGSFVTRLCQHFLDIWRPTLLRQRAFESIYERDAYRCTSPVCQRRDVTPHHLRFRSQGGGDEPENLTALCVWCHLEAIHGGLLSAEPR